MISFIKKIFKKDTSQKVFALKSSNGNTSLEHKVYLVQRENEIVIMNKKGRELGTISVQSYLDMKNNPKETFNCVFKVKPQW